MLIKKRKDSLSGKCTSIKVQLFIIILKLFADRFCKRNFSLKLRIKLLFIPLKQIKLSNKILYFAMLYRALCYTVNILYRTALGVCLYLVKIFNTNRTNTIAVYSYGLFIFKVISEDPWHWHLKPSVCHWNCFYLF